VLQKFQQYLADNRLFDRSHRLLAAVSGGIDSMTMLHLLHVGGYSLAVAHCNFSLRGAESDGDEQLVRNACLHYGLQLFVRQFDTLNYARQKKISVEMAARELRYAWFDELAVQHDFHRVVVAHNANDNAETFLLNLARGTGLRGLTGMSAEQGRVVRPLLFASRGDVEQYAASQQIRYREDSSNGDTRYLRNRIRHRIVPELQQLNPSFLHTMQCNMQHIAQAQHILGAMTYGLRRKACTQQGDTLHISIDALPKHNRSFWLFELLHDYGFSSAVVGSLAEALEGVSGKRFYSPTHLLIKDRGQLLVMPQSEAESGFEVVVEEQVGELTAGNRRFTFELLDAHNLNLHQGSSVALLDLDRLQFPLKLRSWREGDAFVPLGMSGEKKLSDYFIDAKLSLADKPHQAVLCSADGRIAWLVGHRIDERFKLDDGTKKVMKICFQWQ
jgi:tRNA(Ile)-lysidine synthase